MRYQCPNFSPTSLKLVKQGIRPENKENFVLFALTHAGQELKTAKKYSTLETNQS